MAVITPPFVMQGGSHPAATFRQMLLAATMSPAAAFAGGIQATTAGGGHGVVGAGDLAVTQNGTPNMSVNVAAGANLTRGTEALSQGVYAGFNDATVNLSIAAADPTNPRKDLIVFRNRDAFYSGASTDSALVVVTGTAAASPSDPTVPANSLVLARVTVPAAATSILTANITDLRTFATALGGIHRCTSATRPSGESLFEGLYIDELDTDKLWRYDGTTFTLPKNVSGGTVGYASSTSAQTGVSAVTDLTGLSVTFTALAGRRYRISVQVRVTLSTNSGAAEVLITDSSNVVQNMASKTISVGYTDMLQPQAIVVPGAGSVTYKARMQLGGGGTLATTLSATQPSFILVEDNGV